jgi:hypothetical protein
MKVTIQKNEESGEYYFDINELKDILDISKIDTYNIESLETGAFAITFYDVDKNQIMPKKESNETSSK